MLVRAPGIAHYPEAGSPAESLTLLAVPFWRLPFGGDVPRPTSGERRPADHPGKSRKERGRRARYKRASRAATPPSAACARAAAPPTRRPRPPARRSRGVVREAGSSRRVCFPPQQALPLSLPRVKGWRSCRGAPFLLIFLTVPQRAKRAFAG